MQVRGAVHSQGSWCGVQHRSGLLLSLSSSALCCPMDLCFLPVDVVVGGVGMYNYPVLVIPLLHCVLVFTYSALQCSLGLSDIPYGSPCREPGGPLPSSSL